MAELTSKMEEERRSGEARDEAKLEELQQRLDEREQQWSLERAKLNDKVADARSELQREQSLRVEREAASASTARAAGNARAAAEVRDNNDYYANPKATFPNYRRVRFCPQRAPRNAASR